MSEASSDGFGRGRRSTLECFNDEMSVLDRPLENDVEYYDEPPPPARRRWRRVGVIAMLVAVLGCGGFLLRAQQRTAVAASAQPRQEASSQNLVAVASPSASAIAPTPAAKTEPEPEAPVAGPLDGQPPPPSRVAWAKLRRGGHPQHARAGKSHARAHHRGRRAR